MNDLHFEAAWYPREDDAEREPALFETHSRTWYFLREGATTLIFSTTSALLACLWIARKRKK